MRNSEVFRACSARRRAESRRFLRARISLVLSSKKEQENAKPPASYLRGSRFGRDRPSRRREIMRDNIGSQNRQAATPRRRAANANNKTRLLAGAGRSLRRRRPATRTARAFSAGCCPSTSIAQPGSPQPRRAEGCSLRSPPLAGYGLKTKTAARGRHFQFSIFNLKACHFAPLRQSRLKSQKVHVSGSSHGRKGTAGSKSSASVVRSSSSKRSA